MRVGKNREMTERKSGQLTVSIAVTYDCFKSACEAPQKSMVMLCTISQQEKVYEQYATKCTVSRITGLY